MHAQNVILKTYQIVVQNRCDLQGTSNLEVHAFKIEHTPKTQLIFHIFLVVLQEDNIFELFFALFYTLIMSVCAIAMTYLEHGRSKILKGCSSITSPYRIPKR